MQFLGRDTDLTAQAQFTAVDEAGGGVHDDRGGVHSLHPRLGVVAVLGEDRFAVTGAVTRDVADRLVERIDDLDGQYQVEELALVVLVTRRRRIR